MCSLRISANAAYTPFSGHGFVAHSFLAQGSHLHTPNFSICNLISGYLVNFEQSGPAYSQQTLSRGLANLHVDHGPSLCTASSFLTLHLQTFLTLHLQTVTVVMPPPLSGQLGSD